MHENIRIKAVKQMIFKNVYDYFYWLGVQDKRTKINRNFIKTGIVKKIKIAYLKGYNKGNKNANKQKRNSRAS
jgi:hypothetical protein